MKPAPAELIAALYREELRCVLVHADGSWQWEPMAHHVLLPGSFNPVHEGHWKLAEVAERQCNQALAFELSITNVDKPALPPSEAATRVAQFSGRAALLLTRAPTFVDKARLCPGTVFVVGVDTAARLLAPQYYGGNAAGVHEALAEIHHLGCRFLVAGRTNPHGQFSQLSDLVVPAGFVQLFQPIAEADFRIDCSSTSIRSGAIIENLRS